ncbi:hypothetical protein COR50_19280 [Chitinophaga caeni]|uniref:Uncharacterized protein n=1 Tax=Chitinophaga caeni TaxID=2029983 RepID=A0A291QZ68_9BACT|nr:hypothetical protein [Chitinophaga caeni]ATL49144.1 hypothetical protein COR50_19280 [Chitinophaga caeni]
MILTSLSILALLFFVAHVVLLFTSFGKNGYQKTKYLWSHLTLWICGIVAFLITWFYAGKGLSSTVDLFDTTTKKVGILVVVAVLSLIAHSIVRLLVLPRYIEQKK